MIDQQNEKRTERYEAIMNTNLEEIFYVTYLSRFTYLTLPVMGGYSYTSGKFAFHFSTGPELGFLISADCQNVDYSSWELVAVDKKNLKTCHSYWLAEAGMEYSFLKNWSVYAALDFRKALQDLSVFPGKNYDGVFIGLAGVKKTIAR